MKKVAPSQNVLHCLVFLLIFHMEFIKFQSNYGTRLFYLNMENYRIRHRVKSLQTRSFLWSIFSCIWTEKISGFSTE